MKRITISANNQSMERIKLVELDSIPDQVKVTFYTFQEIINKYTNYHFDKYGNLVLRDIDEKIICHLAPSFFCYLGTTQHIHKECGFTIEQVFINSCQHTTGSKDD